LDNAKYIVDTNVYIRRSPQEEYEEEAFPIHWKNFDRLFKEGVIVSIDKVKEELNNKGDAFFLEWTKENEDNFYPNFDSETTPYLRKLSTIFPGWYNQNKEKADYFLIAFAKVKELTLVTQEKMNIDADKEKNYRIPTVCHKIGAKCTLKSCKLEYDESIDYDFECIDFVELVKRERLYNPNLFL